MKQSYWFILALIHNLPENRFGIVEKRRRKKDSCVVGAFCLKLVPFRFERLGKVKSGLLPHVIYTSNSIGRKVLWGEYKYDRPANTKIYLNNS